MSGECHDIHGDIRCDGDRICVRLHREIDHPPESVWRMLTDSVCLSQWLAPGVLEQEEGGRIKLDFGNSGTPIDCCIKAFEPNRRLSYSWSAGNDPERPLTWELTECHGGTLLSLTLSLPNDHLVAISCAGWDAHLEMLMAALEGISIHFPAPRFREAREVFSELLKQKLVA
ncbi:MAG: SRPBCC domain-containing protein [Marinobacter sp.]|nr:SRPBCC domain-containing protein [Marinobacter sp.]